jgi:hypothetical protein
VTDEDVEVAAASALVCIKLAATKPESSMTQNVSVGWPY